MPAAADRAFGGTAAGQPERAGAEERQGRQHGTERPWTSPLNKEYGRGTYVCAACALPLLASDTKFDSGTGRPSFWAPIEGAIGTSVDTAFFMQRTEVRCWRCGGHLGHVFDDGPKPKGLRYCINGVSPKFNPA